MEVDLVTSPMQEEDAFGVDENYQNVSFKFKFLFIFIELCKYFSCNL